MVELDQFKYTLSTYVPMLKELGASLNLDAKKERIAELSRYMEAPDFWDDPERSQKMTKELKSLEDTVKSYTTLSTQYDDISELIEMGYEENDPEVIPVIQESLDEFTTNLEALRLSTLLNGEYDKNNAIIRLNAGAGGTEACDWSSMLYRMYTRYADRNGFSVEVLDMLDGDEAGIKSVTFQVNGENAYGYLKSEKGVHRLVRISPFNAAGKRQTSFVSCDVMPEIEEDLDVEINDDDLRIDTYRSSGAGGQHINKTESAVRITHIPTGLVVECQDERSQYKNKDRAMKILRSRLYEMMLQEQNEKIASERKMQVGTGDRSERIRTYNFPQGRMTDHRIGLTLYRLEDIMNGNLDEILDALATADELARLAGQQEEA